MEIRTFTFCLVIIVLFCVVLLEARGGGRGGGGGFRGGSRGGYRGGSSRGGARSRGGTRSRSYVRTGRGRSIRWQTAAAGGYIFGWSSHSRRRGYSSGSQPTICTNKYDYQMDNGTAYTLFICPMANQGSDMNYCCGSDDRQKCCTSWQKNKAGNIAGIVIGILIFVGVIGVMIYCCCFKKKLSGSKSPPAYTAPQSFMHSASAPVHYAAKDNSVKSPEYGNNYTDTANQPYTDNGAMPYPVAPQEQAPPYDAIPEKGGVPYPGDGAPMGYPVQPDAPPYPPQPYPPTSGEGNGYPATAPPPYPVTTSI